MELLLVINANCFCSGRYAIRAMKEVEPQVKQALQSFPKTVRRKIQMLELISVVLNTIYVKSVSCFCC